MNWQPMIEFGVYALIGVLSFVLWWIIYEWVLTRGYSTRDAVFGHTPNSAVALDIFGGFVAMGILNYTIISGPALSSFWIDIEAVVLTLLGTMVLLALLRMLFAASLRLWFGDRRDGQGHIITVNNELFRQRNLATGFFSTGLYLMLVAGLVEEDLLNLEGDRLAATFNMLGVWVLGGATILLHSWLYLGIGGKQHILHESFHENNPSAPLSMLGLLGGMMILNHQLLFGLPAGGHMFNQGEHWLFLLLGLVTVFVLRWVLYILLLGLLGVSIREQLLIKRNHAWGILDGGLIFALYLILIALIA